MHRIQQERTNSCRQIKPQHISPVYISKVLHLRFSSTRNNFKLWLQRNVWITVSYPHKTAFLGEGCILLYTCRLGLLERWEDTAGSSLHCYYCRDWCLGTQKQRNKWTKQTKDVPQWRAQMCCSEGKQGAGTKRNSPLSRRRVEKKKWHLQFSLYLFAQFRCRFSCASWGTCCFSGLSSFLRPSCYRFLFDLFLGLPTKAFHLEVKRTNGDLTTQTLTHCTVNCKPKNRARSHVMSTVLKSLHPAACSVYYWALINFMQLLGISP